MLNVFSQFLKGCSQFFLVSERKHCSSFAVNPLRYIAQRFLISNETLCKHAKSLTETNVKWLTEDQVKALDSNIQKISKKALCGFSLNTVRSFSIEQLDIYCAKMEMNFSHLVNHVEKDSDILKEILDKLGPHITADRMKFLTNYSSVDLKTYFQALAKSHSSDEALWSLCQDPELQKDPDIQNGLLHALEVHRTNKDFIKTFLGFIEKNIETIASNGRTTRLYSAVIHLLKKEPNLLETHLDFLNCDHLRNELFANKDFLRTVNIQNEKIAKVFLVNSGFLGQLCGCRRDLKELNLSSASDITNLCLDQFIRCIDRFSRAQIAILAAVASNRSFNWDPILDTAELSVSMKESLLQAFQENPSIISLYSKRIVDHLLQELSLEGLNFLRNDACVKALNACDVSQISTHFFNDFTIIVPVLRHHAANLSSDQWGNIIRELLQAEQFYNYIVNQFNEDERLIILNNDYLHHLLKQSYPQAIALAQILFGGIHELEKLSPCASQTLLTVLVFTAPQLKRMLLTADWADEFSEDKFILFKINQTAVSLPNFVKEYLERQQFWLCFLTGAVNSNQMLWACGLNDQELNSYLQELEPPTAAKIRSKIQEFKIFREEVKQKICQHVAFYSSSRRMQRDLEYILDNFQNWDFNVSRAPDHLCPRRLVRGDHGEVFMLLNHGSKKHPLSEQDKILGAGAFKNVTIAINLLTGEISASGGMKVEGPRRDDEIYVQNELGILQQLQDLEGITKLQGVSQYQGKNQYWTYRAFLEFFNGGSLLNFRKHFRQCSLEKKRLVVTTLVSTLLEMHRRQIIHKDFKLENILCHLDEDGKITRIAITDFGHALDLKNPIGDDQYKSPGTYYTLSPELALIYNQIDKQGQMSYTNRASLNKEALKAGEVWALGATLYDLWIGDWCKDVFGGRVDNLEKACYMLKHQANFLNSKLNERPDNPMFELIQQMLHYDPNQRISLEEVNEKISDESFWNNMIAP